MSDSLPTKKKKSKRKKKNEIPVGLIESAIRESNGYISYVAEQLECPVDTVKMYLKKYKALRETLFETREKNLDVVEKSLMEQITGSTSIKPNVLAMMFYLKCMGKHRGWIDRPDKVGSSADKPIHIRILPANGVSPEKISGRPKKAYTQINILPAVAESVEQLIKTKEDIIEGELLN